MLDHCPCNCKTVKCTGTTSDLVQDQKTSGSGISQNIRNLCHFHHKGTLTACQIIRCTHTCKDSVNNSDICFFSRDKASDLCHQYDQGSLSHVGRLTCHVRTCDNGYPFLMVIQICIIRNKHIVLYHLFHNRMTAVFNIYHTDCICLRTYKMISFRNQGKRSKHIQRSHCLGSLLDPHNFFPDCISHITEQFIFQSIQLILCPKDQVFQFF